MVNSGPAYTLGGLRGGSLLVSELAMAKNCEDRQVEDLLSNALAKCKLRFPEASEFEA